MMVTLIVPKVTSARPVALISVKCYRLIDFRCARVYVFPLEICESWRAGLVPIVVFGSFRIDGLPVTYRRGARLMSADFRFGAQIVPGIGWTVRALHKTHYSSGARRKANHLLIERYAW
ncbi:hypothetical protein ZHAS_00011632 [Anopheles sinensis]|uniref:Uncharacterized protein n=1 Tax=Anopheles sinensis TaxID=74873 RepID=A0A084W0P8_ANOSI|nr:hypothetical protein ZHAS_00011632 [Anopheles sinensis]